MKPGRLLPPLILLLWSGACYAEQPPKKRRCIAPARQQSMNTTQQVPSSSFRMLPLIDASARGDLETVHALLRRGVNIYAQDSDGMTALMIAVQNGHERVVNALLRADCRAHSRTSEQINHAGLTVLHLAKDPSIIDRLLSESIDINVAAHGLKRTPLMCAVMNNRVGAAQHLLNRGAALHVYDAQTLTALDYAVHNNAARMGAMLISVARERGEPYPERRLHALLCTAARAGTREMALMLRQVHGSAACKKYRCAQNPLEIALLNGNDVVAQAFFTLEQQEAGCAALNPNQRLKVLLRCAYEGNSGASVEMLVCAGADPYAPYQNGTSFMEHAIEAENVPLAQRMRNALRMRNFPNEGSRFNHAVWEVFRADQVRTFGSCLLPDIAVHPAMYIMQTAQRTSLLPLFLRGGDFLSRVFTLKLLVEQLCRVKKVEQARNLMKQYPELSRKLLHPKDGRLHPYIVLELLNSEFCAMVAKQAAKNSPLASCLLDYTIKQEAITAEQLSNYSEQAARCNFFSLAQTARNALSQEHAAWLFHITLDAGNVPISRLFLEGNTNIRLKPALFRAVQQGAEDMVQEILREAQARKEVIIDYNDPVHKELIQILLEGKKEALFCLLWSHAAQKNVWPGSHFYGELLKKAASNNCRRALGLLLKRVQDQTFSYMQKRCFDELFSPKVNSEWFSHTRLIIARELLYCKSDDPVRLLSHVLYHLKGINKAYVDAEIVRLLLEEAIDPNEKIGVLGKFNRGGVSRSEERYPLDLAVNNPNARKAFETLVLFGASPGRITRQKNMRECRWFIWAHRTRRKILQQISAAFDLHAVPQDLCRLFCIDFYGASDREWAELTSSA